jgi:hypothetical protein
MKLSRIAVAVVAAAAAMSASAQSNVTLYGIIDLGTHTEDSPQFGRKTQHKMMIQWECPEYRIEIEKDGKKLDLPRAISRRYTMSLGKKANLRKDLEAWRGKPFTDDEVRRILCVCDTEWLGMVLFSAWHSLRLGDAASLIWDNIDT